MENLVLSILTLDINTKHFMNFLTTKLLVHFPDFDIFRENLNFKNL